MKSVDRNPGRKEYIYKRQIKSLAKRWVHFNTYRFILTHMMAVATQRTRLMYVNLVKLFVICAIKSIESQQRHRQTDQQKKYAVVIIWIAPADKIYFFFFSKRKNQFHCLCVPLLFVCTNYFPAKLNCFFVLFCFLLRFVAGWCVQ